MSEETTKNMSDRRPFEERVFARFDALTSGLQGLDARLQNLEARAHDTKPIWELALKEIMETRRELADTRRELTRRLDRIEAMALETRVGLRDAEDRIEKLQSRPLR
ncbi:MAG TPA: hypothetical protein VF666_03805 [Pyrinomonadaceae bacterium]|jgi:predicted  nucleic acid-binding Zn-ribbon protein